MTGQRLCRFADLQPERAVAALVDGRQVAVVRLTDDRVFAVDNHDPFSNANVMSRGIVGSTEVDGRTTPTLISPMYKQAFDLTTGRCLSQPGFALDTWPVAVTDGWVEIGRVDQRAQDVA